MKPILEPLIYVSDLQKSIRFYSEVLGFHLGELFPDKDNPTYAPVFIGEYELMLCLTRESNLKFHPRGLGGTGVQLFVQVEDVNKEYANIKGKVELLDEIETKVWGDREFTLKDPDGYLVTFYSPSEQP
jgi:catechol 2,3-dioxygenase-like lactoylglutathione lyase family enzyme